jgi:hypothetical protein
MADPQKHIDQWKHNRDLLSLIPPKFNDWQITVVFYAALQGIDALLAHDNVPGIYSHESRNRVLQRTNRYQFINLKYQPLYDLSRTVRYLADPSKWVDPSKVDKDVIRRYLLPIEHSVQNLMKQNLNLPAIVLPP